MQKFIIICIFILFCLFLTSKGQKTIWPGTVPVYNTLANKDEYVDYTFTLIPSTSVPAGGIIEITFPSQPNSQGFASGLGISPPPVCNFQCTLTSGFVVSFIIPYDILSGVIQKVTIYGVKNPSKIGGTASFIARTRLGNNLYDENLIFAAIGISGQIGTLTSTTVTIDDSSTSNAGEPTKFNFGFKTNTHLPFNTYLELWIPSSAGFEISDQPSCSTYPINGQLISGQIICTKTEASIINVKGFTQDIPAGTDVGISVQLTNPKKTVQSGTFSIVAFRDQTKVAYAMAKNINSVQITPGKISGIVFQKDINIAKQAKNKMIDYKLSFLMKNPLNQGSKIQLQFSAKMPYIYSQSYSYIYIISGLEDQSELIEAQINQISQTKFEIINFAPIQVPEQINLIIRLLLPALPGPSDSILISSFNNAGEKIDQDLTEAFTQVENINSELSQSSVTATHYIANQSNTDITFTFTPPSTIGAKSIIQVLVPSQFTVTAITSANCLVKGSASYDCKKKDNLITITMNNQQYNSAVPGNFQIINCIRTPILAPPPVLFDVTILSPDQSTVIYSFSQYIIITPQQLNDASIELMPNEASAAGKQKVTMARIKFQTILKIPRGKYAEKTTDEVGLIILNLCNLFSANLGTGLNVGDSLPCKGIYGIKPIENENLICTLDNYKIQVKNFLEIAPDTQVEIHFPGIIMPQSTGSCQCSIDLVSKQNRIRTILNQYQIIIYIQPNTWFYGTTSINYVFSDPPQTSNNFDFTFKPSIAGTAYVYPGDYIFIDLPVYDIGYITDYDIVSCSITDIPPNTPLYQVHPCESYKYLSPNPSVYPSLNQIAIRIVNQTYNNQNNQITIKNLKWPRYPNSVGKLVWRHQNFTAQNWTEREMKQVGDTAVTGGFFQQPAVNPFLESLIIVPIKDKSYVGAHYEFYFRPTNLIPNGGKVVLTFPSEFDIQAPVPPPIFTVPQFSSAGPSLPLTMTATASNVLEITNIGEFPAEAPFTIIAEGLRNPTITPSSFSQGWKIETYFGTSLINQKTVFDEFTYGNTFSVGTIIFQSVTAFPLNAAVYADYTITFTPSQVFLPKTKIKITFPAANYPSIPTSLECRLTGGLTTFESCTKIAAQTIEIIADKKYYSGSISFTVKNILNPAAGVTQGFVIIIQYDSVNIDQTDTLSTIGRTVKIEAAANPLTIQSIDFFPKNEAEVATYVFKLLPTNVINDQHLMIIDFPRSYDNRLGDNVGCRAVGGMNSKISCSISFKRVTIEGLSDYTPNPASPIQIEITNIVNPNAIYNTNGFVFKIGYLKRYTQNFIDYNPSYPALQMQLAPGWAYVFNISIPDQKSFIRIKTQYTFNVTNTINIPTLSNQGQIIIDFPKQFDIPDKSTQCTSDALQKSSNPLAQQSTLSCSTRSNSVTVSGNQDTYNGTFILKVQNIENPIEVGSCDTITVKTYDGLNKVILEKSYVNLDPSYFYFTIPGPLITVNDDQQIVIERGTFSKDTKIDVVYPCALNLTLIPTAVDKMLIVPSFISLNLGDLKQTFRVTVPQDFNAGNYFISWQTVGDLSDAYYTPIKKTSVKITAIRNIRVDVGVLYEIPRGGTSLQTTISTDYAPNINLEIVIQFAQRYIGMSLSTDRIVLNEGDNSGYFTIFCADNSTINNGQVLLSLEGVNKLEYVLSKSTLDFQIIGKIVEPPSVTDLYIKNPTQTYVDLVIGASEVSLAYYMLALKGTQAPSLDEVNQQIKNPYNTTRTRYGKVFIDKTNKATISVTGLQAQVYYVVYAYTINRGGLWSERKFFEFTTQDRHSAATFTMQFKQAYLNKSERENIMKVVAFLLSLKPEQVLQQKYYFAARRSRQFRQALFSKRQMQVQGPTTTLDLQIYANPYSENFPKPIELVTRLNELEKERLIENLPNIDKYYLIKGTEFAKYQPSFVEVPSAVEITTNSVLFQVKIDNFGYTYSSAVAAKADKGKPLAMQIYWGFDVNNIMMPNQNVENEVKFQAYYMMLRNLEQNTEYNIYIVAGSAHPGYPDLMDDKNIQVLLVKTLFIPIPPDLNINNDPILHFIINYVITLMSIVVLIIY